MNAKEALEALNRGEKVRTIFDGTDIFYQAFQFDVIARMVTKSYCTAETIASMNPEEFLQSVDGIEMVKI